MTAEPPSRLKWRCRRGMRELDAVLERFLSNGFGALDSVDKARFETLLELPDPDLHAYLVGRRVPPEDLVALIVAIRNAAEG